MPKKKEPKEDTKAEQTPEVKMSHEQAISVYINRVMTDVGYVQKKDENKFQKYKYAGESALLAALRPAMVRHGLVLFPSVENV